MPYNMTPCQFEMSFTKTMSHAADSMTHYFQCKKNSMAGYYAKKEN